MKHNTRLNKPDIVQTIQAEGILLKRYGRRYKAKCPLHSENTPLFTVYPDTQSFFCHGCQAGGDVIDFIMKLSMNYFWRWSMKKFDREEQLLKDYEEGKINIGKEPSDNDTDQGKQHSSSQAEKILQLVSGLEFFHDEHNHPYTFVDGKAFSLESKKFSLWLSYRYQKAEKRAPSRESLNQAISTMAGKAIMTTAGGWNVVDAPILFRHFSHLK